jgi:serine/threonine protein kinase
MTSPGENSPRPKSLANVPEKIGRYRVLGRIGHGGMATVYLGKSDGPSGFERLVAIKILHEHLSTEKRIVEMFLEEARVAARIRHPNVVPVIEVGQDQGRYFLVMEYIHGESLLTVMIRSWTRNKNFPTAYAAYLLTGASDGLHAAHELVGANGKLLKVVHRDVSPHNFLVGYDGVIRISDFGIVKISDEIAHTQSGVKGKVAYMAPEQALGKGLDRRTDLFALGVVMWEMLVGRRLFKSSTDFKTLQNVCSRDVLAPSVFRDSLSPELDRIVLRLLQRDPEDRYETAGDVSRDLRAFLVSEGEGLFSNDIATFIGGICADRRQKKIEMEKKFQQEEHYDAAGLFSETSDGGLLDTIQGEADSVTPSETAARELQQVLRQRLQDLHLNEERKDSQNQEPSHRPVAVTTEDEISIVDSDQIAFAPAIDVKSLDIPEGADVSGSFGDLADTVIYKETGVQAFTEAGGTTHGVDEPLTPGWSRQTARFEFGLWRGRGQLVLGLIVLGLSLWGWSVMTEDDRAAPPPASVLQGLEEGSVPDEAASDKGEKAGDPTEIVVENAPALGEAAKDQAEAKPESIDTAVKKLRTPIANPTVLDSPAVTSKEPPPPKSVSGETSAPHSADRKRKSPKPVTRQPKRKSRDRAPKKQTSKETLFSGDDL